MAYSASRLTLYALLSAMEEDMREAIAFFLEPEKSPVEILGEDVFSQAVKRSERDWKLEGEQASLGRLLLYTDFPDLIKLINTHKALLVADVARHYKLANPKLDRLVAIRNRVAHSRPLDFDDLAVTTMVAEELVKDRGDSWPRLMETIARLRNDPSFVLGLTIPSEDALNAKKHNLPTPDFDETGFVGRRQQVIDLVKSCLGPYPVITIVGDGGVGKTALALKVAYDILDLPECPFQAVVWTTSKTMRITPHEIQRIEGAICDSLGMLHSVATELAGVESRDPLEEVIGYLSEFKILLILDNLETVIDDRIRDFLGRLPSGSKILITSRIGLGAFEYPVKLQPMDENEAVQLTRALAKIRGVGTLQGLPNDRLKAYCRQMKFNPGWIKWFVSAVQAGKRPEEVLDRPDMFLEFCMSNVYDYLNKESRKVLRSMVVIPGRHSQAELLFLNEMQVLTLQRALQQLLTTNMVTMTSVPKGSSSETQYQVSDMARTYLQKHHPVSAEEFGHFSRRRQQLVQAGQQLDADRHSSPYSPNSVMVRSASDKIVAKYLIDTLGAARREDFETAEELLGTARGLAPDYFEVHRVEAWVRVAQQNIPAAQSAYETAVELEPQSAPLRLWFGGFLLRYLDDVDAALVHLKEAVSLDKSAVEVQMELARAYIAKREFPSSRTVIDALLSRSDLVGWNRKKAVDLDLQHYQRLAEHLTAQRDYPGAVGALEQLKESYLRCPSTLVDSIMKDRLRRALPSAEACAFYLQDERLRSVASELAAWLADSVESSSREVPVLSSRDRKQGTVVKLLVDYGFVRTGDGAEIFFHRNDLVKSADWRKMRIGTKLDFLVIENKKGPRAINVVRDSNAGEDA